MGSYVPAFRGIEMGSQDRCWCFLYCNSLAALLARIVRSFPYFPISSRNDSNRAQQALAEQVSSLLVVVRGSSPLV